MIKKPHIATVFLILIPFSLCFWERASTLCIFLYALAVLFQGDLAGRFREALRQGWIYPFLLLYFFQAASLLWSDDIMAGWFVLEKKASLLVLPLIIGMDTRLRGEMLHALLFSLIVGCAAALAFCLSYAVWEYVRLGDPAVFFYHRFSWPLDEFNAMYFSFYLFTGLAALHYLVREVDYPPLHRRWTQVILFATLLVGLLLLSSRLFIVLTGIYVLLAVLQAIPGKMRWGWTLGLLLLTSGVFLSGFTRERFGQLLDSRFEVLRLERFEYDTPFSGLTLRLLFLKFGWEILLEKNAWLTGVGAGDARSEMDAKIVQYNLYHGNPSLGDRGYLGYGFHNQYMETWVQAGLPALGCWLWLLAWGWRRGIQNGRRYPLIYLVAALTAFALVEDVMERQRGIVFVTCLLSSFYATQKE